MSKARRYQHFGLIVFMDFLCAWYDTCFGPIIPYYSAATGIDETDYSYLFMVKSAANIFGSILLSVIIEKLSTQKLLILYLLIATAALILSSLSLTTVNLSLTIFFATLTILSATDIAYLITVSLFLGN
jgi:predicted MFS family arabinose efflux permease